MLESEDCRQAPIVTGEWISGAAGASILPHCVRVEVPADVEPMLADSDDDAARWRHSVRRGIQWGLSSGYSVKAFALEEGGKLGYYLMTRSVRPSIV